MRRRPRRLRQCVQGCRRPAYRGEDGPFVRVPDGRLAGRGAAAVGVDCDQRTGSKMRINASCCALSFSARCRRRFPSPRHTGTTPTAIAHQPKIGRDDTERRPSHRAGANQVAVVNAGKAAGAKRRLQRNGDYKPDGQRRSGWSRPSPGEGWESASALRRNCQARIRRAALALRKGDMDGMIADGRKSIPQALRRGRRCPAKLATGRYCGAVRGGAHR